MPGSISGADAVRQPEALKGRQITAQGKAQRRPGFTSPHKSQALKGRHNRCSPREPVSRPDCFALTGLEMSWADEPLLSGYMDLNQQKARFSVAYAHAVATVAGFKLGRWDVDDGSCAREICHLDEEG